MIGFDLDGSSSESFNAGPENSSSPGPSSASKIDGYESVSAEHLNVSDTFSAEPGMLHISYSGVIRTTEDHIDHIKTPSTIFQTHSSGYWNQLEELNNQIVAVNPDDWFRQTHLPELLIPSRSRSPLQPQDWPRLPPVSFTPTSSPQKPATIRLTQVEPLGLEADLEIKVKWSSNLIPGQ